jgi:hypothetical protein
VYLDIAGARRMDAETTKERPPGVLDCDGWPLLQLLYSLLA